MLSLPTMQLSIVKWRQNIIDIVIGHLCDWTSIPVEYFVVMSIVTLQAIQPLYTEAYLSVVVLFVSWTGTVSIPIKNFRPSNVPSKPHYSAVMKPWNKIANAVIGDLVYWISIPIINLVIIPVITCRLWSHCKGRFFCTCCSICDLCCWNSIPEEDLLFHLLHLSKLLFHHKEKGKDHPTFIAHLPYRASIPVEYLSSAHRQRSHTRQFLPL